MKLSTCAAASLPILLWATAAQANNWEKYFTRLPGTESAIASTVPPERISSQGSLDADMGAMWKRGYGPIGYTSFSSPNGKTKDAERLAKKLKARYYIALTELTSSYTASIPLTLPSNTSSTTTGNFSTMGTGGYNTGTFSGTTTTYGSRTTYIPMTVNRVQKFGLYFAEAPKVGTGIFPRDLTPDEIAKYETQRGFGIRFVREGSPAYEANLLPGDVVLKVNGLPADLSNWKAAANTGRMVVHLARNGEPREVVVHVPLAWRTAN